LTRRVNSLSQSAHDHALHWNRHFPLHGCRGSTRLLKRLGKRYGEALADHRTILRTAARAYAGDEVDNQGDWPLGELAYRRWRAGLLAEVPAGTVEPYAAQIAGKWSRAAELWTALGCPYQAAWALTEGGDEDTLRRALDAFERLGARPASATVAARLR
jgi:hypothetical protein